MSRAEQTYIPGMCNINTAEVAYRKKAMISGFIVAGVIFVALYAAGLAVWIRALVVFVPLYIGVIGYFQVKNRFCVSYGASGKQNATEGNPTAVDIEAEEARIADKKKARKMNLQALAITLVILVLSLLIPAL